ncbi:hypothetical protein ACLOJK_031857 [Asimina triloba]
MVLHLLLQKEGRFHRRRRANAAGGRQQKEADGRAAAVVRRAVGRTAIGQRRRTVNLADGRDGFCCDDTGATRWVPSSGCQRGCCSGSSGADDDEQWG